MKKRSSQETAGFSLLQLARYIIECLIPARAVFSGTGRFRQGFNFVVLAAVAIFLGFILIAGTVIIRIGYFIGVVLFISDHSAPHFRY